MGPDTVRLLTPYPDRARLSRLFHYLFAVIGMFLMSSQGVCLWRTTGLGFVVVSILLDTPDRPKYPLIPHVKYRDHFNF